MPLIFLDCGKQKDTRLFLTHQGDNVGIDFQNTITTSDTFNSITYEYLYNGSGVGVGDFNSDGLQDVFFGGNQVSCRLYLNKGNLQFEDITEAAGVSTDRWVTGVSVVDINRDGKPDVFLAVAGYNKGETMRDLLFINEGNRDGVPHFSEQAKAYGIDDDGYGTMGAFFDYDKDGDADLYLLRNALESFNRNNIRPKRIHNEGPSNDRLYRNNGDNTFTDVSEAAGITIEGYGLGVSVADINVDGWPDVYASNDFLSNDIVWINQRDGTFKNMAGEYLKHQTHNGMGNDVADFNNDGLPDIVVVDMLPPGHERQKMMTPGQNYDHFHSSLDMGYQPQYMRNTLQLNRGKCSDGKMLFSEISFMSGVSSTDWSWAPLFADLDNDGRKDLFIGNGYRKDVTDLDFVFFSLGNFSPFGTQEKKNEKITKELSKLADVKLLNRMFRNTGSLSFDDKTEDWGIEEGTFANGAAYADFDNDGDLDLITNNIDQPVTLYENRAKELFKDNHSIALNNSDTGVCGQKVFVYTGNDVQYQELMPYRGFQSTVSTALHFGVGENRLIDSIRIMWPDSAVLTLTKVRVDTTISFSRSMASVTKQVHPVLPPRVKFQPIDPINFSHKEQSPPDIKIVRTLMHELTRFGPCLASGDVNNDGLDDLFVGGEGNRSSSILIQTANSSFIKQSLPSDSTSEEGAAHFFDADSDGDLDLYVGSACYAYLRPASDHRLFLNDGKGHFTLSVSALPKINTSSSCVVSADYDGDGDLDLFVGGRITPNAYPAAARSFLLQNDQGKFTDVTENFSPGLLNPGMVSSAVWTDVNSDKKPDLVLAGEWMPVMVFTNSGSGLIDATQPFGLDKTNGWWNCVRAADLDSDGFPEIIAGNTGSNSFFRASEEHPVELIAKDFDNNGAVDPIVTYYNPVEKERFIVHNRLVLIDQIPFIKRRFDTFRKYATTSFEKALNPDELKNATTLRANVLASVVLHNDQGKKFSINELPESAQFSTVNDIAVDDLDNDGRPDLVLIGNNYAQETLFGQYDASLGTVLLGDKTGEWTTLENRDCNFIADLDARAIAVLRGVKGSRIYVISNNNGPLQFFAIK